MILAAHTVEALVGLLVDRTISLAATAHHDAREGFAKLVGVLECRRAVAITSLVVLGHAAKVIVLVVLLVARRDLLAILDEHPVGHVHELLEVVLVLRRTAQHVILGDDHVEVSQKQAQVIVDVAAAMLGIIGDFTVGIDRLDDVAVSIAALTQALDQRVVIDLCRLAADEPVRDLVLLTDVSITIIVVAHLGLDGAIARVPVALDERLAQKPCAAISWLVPHRLGVGLVAILADDPMLGGERDVAITIIDVVGHRRDPIRLRRALLDDRRHARHAREVDGEAILREQGIRARDL